MNSDDFIRATLSSHTSQFQVFWTRMNSSEPNKERRGRTFEWHQVDCGGAAWRNWM